ELFAAYDIVVDYTDNIAAKYMLADACTRIGKPLVYGTIVGYEGYVTTFVPGGATLRDLFGDMPEPGQIPSPAVVGTFGPAVGVIGSLQAAEVLKWITGAGDLLTGRLLYADTRTMDFSVLTV
ncbi:MAG: ThiF family adenylyltransferase, partial [Bacteroidales bacterium]|nr:ThiF family adenylyltransferase [Bacteroidales bacterium]